jgi:hypothetical protein
MKRDMDLIRRIALATEVLQPTAQLTNLDEIDRDSFTQHAHWMNEAGLIHGWFDTDQAGQLHAVVYRLTWAGCEFLDAARSDTLWNKAKENVLKPSASWTFGLVREWLNAEIREGFPTLRS